MACLSAKQIYKNKWWKKSHHDGKVKGNACLTVAYIFKFSFRLSEELIIHRQHKSLVHHLDFLASPLWHAHYNISLTSQSSVTPNKLQKHQSKNQWINKMLISYNHGVSFVGELDGLILNWLGAAPIGGKKLAFCLSHTGDCKFPSTRSQNPPKPTILEIKNCTNR